MIYRKPTRPGVTLMEVLVATGILAIGLLAIMALFPIGAVSMARALNQSRAADHAANSDAIMRHYWKQAWLEPNSGSVRPLDQAVLTSNEPMLAYLDRFPGDPLPPLGGRIPATSSQPSYPVLVDPIGYRTQTGASNSAVGGFTNILPTRTTLAAALADPLPLTTVRLTTLLDDFTYDVNGEPSADSGQLERAGRYTSAWLIQRPKNNVPHEVHVQVLVYAGRSPTDTPSLETVHIASANNYFDGIDPKPNTVTIPFGAQPKPAIHKGAWVAFAVGLQPLGGTAIPGFDFYRVASITDDSATQITVEFEQPLKSYATTSFAAGTYSGGTLTGVVVVFENLIEVFDRGIMSATGISGR